MAVALLSKKELIKNIGRKVGRSILFRTCNKTIGQRWGVISTETVQTFDDGVRTANDKANIGVDYRSQELLCQNQRFLKVF